jgi:hypothetical protein
VKADRGSPPRPTITPNENEALDRPLNEPAEPLPVRDPVDESSKQSFPASDPPSWWAGPRSTGSTWAHFA